MYTTKNLNDILVFKDLHEMNYLILRIISLFGSLNALIERCDAFSDQC